MFQALIRLFILTFVLLAPGIRAFAGEVNLSIAASLKEVINDLTAAYTAKHPATTFVKNFGGSGTLAGQIENGAPADIFIAANNQWMDYLKEKKFIVAASEKNFAFNTLVFAGTTTKKVSSMNDLVMLDKIAIGSPKSVPAGEYATAAMQKAGIAEKLSGKLIMAKDVRECLMYAELGEVDGAFVYRTDALQAKKAKLLFTVPQNLYPRVTYPMGLISKSAGNREAKDFLAFLQGKEANAVLDKYGFLLK
ncbi:MAG: molybdate ABC transporter substrate-binding protein [Chlorobiaceae bacterium]|nr:molybdate ABC transporter substrate-binding protein [Chlorobiaceae bacterium]